MDSTEIYNALYRLFHNYDYKLINSFLYDWESDFFGMSKSGYKVEVEVKVSRGDYFRDFDKEKHELFKCHAEKKTHWVRNLGSGRNLYNEHALICRYIQPHISFENERKWRKEPRNGVWGYVVNDYGREYVRKAQNEIYAQFTRIKIKPLADILCPNQFYFATPQGLITEAELPKYAGLITVGDGEARIIKRAPYLHKVHQPMTSELLNKFYNLWTYRVGMQEKIEIMMSGNDP